MKIRTIKLVPIPFVVDQECDNNFDSEMENLCPTWHGEYNDISHLNTSSIDNIVSLFSLLQDMIAKARKFAGISLNLDVQRFILLKIIARLMNIR